jgi:hypothetical protein
MDAFFIPPPGDDWARGDWDPVKDGLSFREWTIRSVESYNIRDDEYAGFEPRYAARRQALVSWWSTANLPTAGVQRPATDGESQGEEGSMARVQAALDMAMSQGNGDQEMGGDLDEDAEGEDDDEFPPSLFDRGEDPMARAQAAVEMAMSQGDGHNSGQDISGDFDDTPSPLQSIGPKEKGKAKATDIEGNSGSYCRCFLFFF